MTLSLPPIIPWEKNRANMCAFGEIFSYWKDYDILTFLVGLGIYHPSLCTFLDSFEKEKELRYKTAISHKRFVVSRSILKHILLNILLAPNLSDIILIRREDGRILVKDFPEVYISLSYSGTSIAITVGKRKIGSDIEVLRPMDIRKTQSYPLFTDKNCRNDKERIQNFLHQWTLIEAYAKLHDSIPYPYLMLRDFPRDADFVSYCINNSSVFSLASGLDMGKDALFWLDTAVAGFSSQTDEY